MPTRIVATDLPVLIAVGNRPTIYASIEPAWTGRTKHGIGGVMRLCAGGDGRSSEVALSVNGMAGSTMGRVLQWVSNHESLVMLGHCFGAYATPGGTALFCFDCIAPSGSRFLPKEV
jgi:hypothetical protein